MELKDVFNNQTYHKVFEACLDPTKEEVTYNGKNWTVGQSSIVESKEVCNVFQRTLGKFFCWLHTKFSKSYSAKVEHALQSMQDALTKYQKAAQKTDKVAQETVAPKIEVKPPPEDPAVVLKRVIAEKGEQIQKLQDSILRFKRSAWDLNDQEQGQTKLALGTIENLNKQQVELVSALDNLNDYLKERHTLDEETKKWFPKKDSKKALADFHKQHPPFLERINLYPRDFRVRDEFENEINARLEKVKEGLKAANAQVDAAADIKADVETLQTKLQDQEKLLAATKDAQISDYKEMQKYSKEPIPELEPVVDPLDTIKTELDDMSKRVYQAEKDHSPEYEQLLKEQSELRKKEKVLLEEGSKQLRALKKFQKNPLFIEDADRAFSALLQNREPMANITEWNHHLTKIYQVYLNKTEQPGVEDLLEMSEACLAAINPEKATSVREAIAKLPQDESNPDYFAYLMVLSQFGKKDEKI